MKPFTTILTLSLWLALAAAFVGPSALGGPAMSAAAARPSLQAQWDKALAAAKTEGRVLVYSSNGPELRKGLADIVRDKFNITMDFVAASPGEVYQKYLTEHRAGIHNGDMNMSGEQPARAQE